MKSYSFEKIVTVLKTIYGEGARHFRCFCNFERLNFKLFKKDT